MFWVAGVYEYRSKGFREEKSVWLPWEVSGGVELIIGEYKCMESFIGERGSKMLSSARRPWRRCNCLGPFSIGGRSPWGEEYR